MNRGNILRACLRWLIAAALVWAALGKLANPQEFYGAILGYQLPLPAVLARATAVVLPWIELLCGLLLAANHRRGAALAWALLLFVVFAIVTAQAWLRGLRVACGCFDLHVLGIAQDSDLAHFFESLAFAFFRAVLLASAACYLFRREVSTQRRPEPGP